MPSKTEPQILHTPGGEDLIVLTRSTYDALVLRAEAAAGYTPEEDAADLATVRAYHIARERGEALLIPGEVVEAILDAENPVGPLRRWRGLTQVELAARAGLAQSHLSQIERGRRGGLDSLRKIAKALDMPVSVLIDE